MKIFNKPNLPYRIFPWIFLGMVLTLGGCGGGTDANANGAAPVSAARSLLTNVVTIDVDIGPGNAINIPYVSVTLCIPSTSQCQTIDHMIVDTGSSGIRVFASKLDASLKLPQQIVGGSALAECAQYADSSVWGPIKIADVQIGGERASSLAVQVLADPSFPPVPSACSNTGIISQTPASFGGNGIIGLGPFQQDCGAFCAGNANSGIYYQCIGKGCQGAALPITSQVHNPVALFAIDNNGVVIVLPPLGDAGAPSALGSLVFGIGTQSNNRINEETIIALDASNGGFTTEYKGKQYPKSFLDSGSNGIFFTDLSINVCGTRFYCPPAPLQLSATNRGTNGTVSTISFRVTNADVLLASDSTASGTLAGIGGDSNRFNFGLSFFFGKTVFTALEGRSTPGGAGPYFAY